MHNAGISIVIPVYNGSGTLELLVNKINSVLTDFIEYEIILVDDSSPDNSLAIINNLIAKQDNITGIALDGNYGQQNAILCGLRYASMEYTVIMDDDFEHNPGNIPKLYEEIIKGFDAVYALNSIKTKTSLIRGIGSKLRDKTFDWLTKKPKEIKVCSYRILNRKTVDEVTKANRKFVYISMEILKYTNNLANIEVPYGVRKTSGHNTRKLIKLLFNIVLYYSDFKLLKRMRKNGPSYRVASISGKGT